MQKQSTTRFSKCYLVDVNINVSCNRLPSVISFHHETFSYNDDTLIIKFIKEKSRNTRNKDKYFKKKKKKKKKKLNQLANELVIELI